MFSIVHTYSMMKHTHSKMKILLEISVCRHSLRCNGCGNFNVHTCNTIINYLSTTLNEQKYIGSYTGLVFYFV